MKAIRLFLIFFLGSVLCYMMGKGFELGFVSISNQLENAKQVLVMRIIEHDLENVPLTLDLRTDQKAKIKTFKPGDYQKALWVLHTKNEQLEIVIDSIKNAIGNDEPVIHSS